MLKIEFFADYKNGKVIIELGNGFDSGSNITVDIEDLKQAVNYVAKDLSENEQGANRLRLQSYILGLLIREPGQD